MRTPWPSDHVLGNQETPRELERVPQSQQTEISRDQSGHLELVPSDRGVPEPWAGGEVLQAGATLIYHSTIGQLPAF